MANVEDIARACSDRLEAMVFGPADYAASIQAWTTNIGGANPDYAMLTDPDEPGARERHWSDQWHYAISRMVAVCRAYGLRPIDGPFGDIGDPDGFVAAAGRRVPGRAADRRRLDPDGREPRREGGADPPMNIHEYQARSS